MLLKKTTETTKYILEHMQNPERLENHPWVMSAFTKEYLSNHPDARGLSPGRQLALAFANLFIESMPPSPPRRGKRLDTRWGEYGLLAAQYVVPFLTGKANPRSFKEAWSGIDQAIVFLVVRQSELDEVKAAQEYQLIANEPEAANSTISDWHRKGIERFAEFILLREEHIEAEAQKKSQAVLLAKPVFNYRRFFLFALIALLATLSVGGIWGYFKAQRMLELAGSLRQDLQGVQQLDFSIETLEDTDSITQSLQSIDQNLRLLDEEARPYLWLTASMGWLPTYGGDLENSQALLDMALFTNDSLQQTYQAILPLVDLLGEDQPSTVDGLILQITASQPALISASQSLQQASQQRDAINVSRLSPQVRELLEEKIDPALAQLENGLSIALAMPGLLGAGSDGLKTYMIVLQNEDELRATGGFLTAVGTVVVRDGKIVNMVFEDSYDFDDLDKPYPVPPWQLLEYMDAGIYLLRDSNWSPDFPTTVSWVEYLYAYTRGHSVDGIIAITQHTIVKLLETTGPIVVEGYDTPISSRNVLQVMRESKVRPEEIPGDEWDRKEFISVLAPPLMEKIMSGDGFAWSDMLKTTTNLLDEKHILLQFDEPNISALLAEQGWDGQVSPFAGDFLMLVDSNIGFSKNNRLIEQKIELEIDLRDLEKPQKYLELSYHNPIQSDQDCGDSKVPEDERWYPISRCYGNYLRIYTPEGSLLKASTPHAVPAEWALNGQRVPARVDILTDDLDGFGVFGTYFVVPFQTTLLTSFHFDTPASVIEHRPNDSVRYVLKIQKQPGTFGIPLSFRLFLPEDAEIIRAPGNLTLENGALNGSFQLNKDIVIEVVFFP